MADRTLRTTVHIGGVAYGPGTTEADIAPEHREGITNPNVWASEEDERELVVQSAPVYDLPAEPGSEATDVMASGYDPAAAGQGDAPEPKKATRKRASDSPA